MCVKGLEATKQVWGQREQESNVAEKNLDHLANGPALFVERQGGPTYPPGPLGASGSAEEERRCTTVSS